jgi:hypothetical protein
MEKIKSTERIKGNLLRNTKRRDGDVRELEVIRDSWVCCKREG